MNIQIGDTVGTLIQGFVSAIPNIIGAFAVIIVGWIIAKLVAKFLKKVLENIGVDRLAVHLNEIDIVNKANIKFVPSTLLPKIVYYLLMLLFALAATDVLNMTALSDLMRDIIAYIPKLISALIVFIIGLLLAEFIKNIVLTACQSIGIPSAKIISTFIFYFLFLTVTMSAIAQAEINTDLINSNLTMILGGGVLAFAIGYGFASKDMMANFLSSFYSKEKFLIGDEISIDNVRGRIIAMDSTSITLQTEESRIIIPLSKFISQKVEIYENI